jgi:hypothetical protein
MLRPFPDPDGGAENGRFGRFCLERNSKAGVPISYSDLLVILGTTAFAKQLYIAHGILK